MSTFALSSGPSTINSFSPLLLKISSHPGITRHLRTDISNIKDTDQTRQLKKQRKRTLDQIQTIHKELLQKNPTCKYCRREKIRYWTHETRTECYTKEVSLDGMENELRGSPKRHKKTEG